MNVKQIRSQIAVLAVTVIAVLAVLLALSTVTSDAASVVYDETTRTYTMSDSTYSKQIKLDKGTSTTIVISGDNKLTYSGKCIYGDGDLTIIGNGTLELTKGYISCNDFTIGNKANLIVDGSSGTSDIQAPGNVTVDNASIEIKSGYMSCGMYNNTQPQKHVFKNASLKTGIELYGDADLNGCNVTVENSVFSGYGGTVSIDGGTYNFTKKGTSASPAMTAEKVIIRNAVIKSNAFFMIENLEITDTNFETTLPQAPSGSSAPQYPALYSADMVISGSKINVDGGGFAGIFSDENLTIRDNTELNIKSKYFGIVGGNVQIIHSGGKIQVADSENACAAVAAIKMGNSSSSTATSGTLTLNAAEMKEPAGGTIGEAKVKPDPSQSTELTITAIMDGKNPAKTVVLEAVHTWDAGKVTKQPTSSAEGVKIYTCTVCGAAKTEAIPKLGNGEDGTPFGKGASVEAAEAALFSLLDDNDPAGTVFGLLQLKATKVTKNSIKLKWKAVPGATRYMLYANKCGKGNKYKKLGIVNGTSFTATQAAGAKIQKGTYYKFMMIAADSSGRVITTSKTVHAATKGGKVGNHKKVTVKKSVTRKARKLKKGKTLKLKAKAVPQARKLKVRKHRGIKYETSNAAVAQVNGKGKVKGVRKGTCYIYAYAQNGICAKVKVTVK